MTALIPREPRKLRQPTKEVLREQLALAADEIIRLRAAMDGVTFASWGWSVETRKRPWWRRIFRNKTDG